MTTQSTPNLYEFKGIGNRKVQADFGGGHISSDGGALLLREMDARLELSKRLAACFTDYRDQGLIEHSLEELLRQRVLGLALGYEDLNDHDDLRHDPLLSTAVGKEDPLGENRKREQDRGRAMAGKSTLNRLELTPDTLNPANRYQKTVHHGEKIEDLFVTLFLEGYAQDPEEIVLDFDATDDPLHGGQEGRFYHGYYRSYCYLPLYVFCGDFLLAAKLRTSDRDASDGALEILERLVNRIRERWPNTRIVYRGDSGFARDNVMTWCEANDVYYLLGLAKNSRLLETIEAELAKAKALYEEREKAARVFAEFHYSTRDTWSCARRVIAKAEHLEKGANPRFVVTNLPEDYADPKALYEKHYCARGDMENRIKEQQLDLFADRTSTATIRANQLRLWLSSMAYVLMSALRRQALKGTRMANATCGTIRLRLLKIGALVKVSVRRVFVQLASACPYKDVFVQAWQNLQNVPQRG